ncbi:carbohydrate ABC transporter permease [Terrabacter sp. GCM10028922]|uniref:carbohydrate ABC transporter permease n=1 Tax=Terrabacter sp. GCM10028922 TaxID=3273428 RepID=UPI003613C6CF
MVISSRAANARTTDPRGDAGAGRPGRPGRPGRKQPRPSSVRDVKAHTYPYWFYAPAGVVYGLIFLVPTFIAFYFAFTRWTLFESEFIGLDNFRQFFSEQALVSGLKNTLIYAVVTSGLKVVLGMLLAVLLTGPIRSRGLMRSVIFFPVLVSTVAVGITFSVLLQPDFGLVSIVLAKVGITSPDWLGDPGTALLSVALVDVWKGVGLATLIYIAGILAIPRDYYEAVDVDGGGAWTKFWNVTVPLARPATFTVILLSLIGGLRSFDLIWTMTGGGPGFSSDVIASIIYKTYQAGFFGLSTAGNVVLFILVTLIVYPLSRYFNSREVES